MQRESKNSRKSQPVQPVRPMAEIRETEQDPTHSTDPPRVDLYPQNKSLQGNDTHEQNPWNHANLPSKIHPKYPRNCSEILGGLEGPSENPTLSTQALSSACKESWMDERNARELPERRRDRTKKNDDDLLHPMQV